MFIDGLSKYVLHTSRVQRYILLASQWKAPMRLYGRIEIFSIGLAMLLAAVDGYVGWVNESPWSLAGGFTVITLYAFGYIMFRYAWRQLEVARSQSVNLRGIGYWLINSPELAKFVTFADNTYVRKVDAYILECAAVHSSLNSGGGSSNRALYEQLRRGALVLYLLAGIPYSKVNRQLDVWIRSDDEWRAYRLRAFWLAYYRAWESCGFDKHDRRRRIK